MTVIQPNRRFIAMPDFLNLKKQNIKYLDAFIYLTIRSFHNSSTGLCYPSYETIAERSGASRSFVAASIKRLEFAGFLKIVHSKQKHVCNQYQFENLSRFERIPYDLFDVDLTVNQKAMLLCLRQFFNEGHLQTTKTVSDFANRLGVSYKTVYSQYVELVDLGFILKKQVHIKGRNKNVVWLNLSNKIDWNYNYTPAAAASTVVYPKLRVA